MNVLSLGNQLMIADSRIVPECVYRPGSFAGLMTLYESNYIKLSQLIAEFDSFPEAHAGLAVSSSEEDCDLYLAVKRRRPYTTTLKLTYLFAPDGPDARRSPSIPDPDLWVLVYHDARLVEARRPRTRLASPEFAASTPAWSRELQWRWRDNMMLNKWLDYLILRGHRFSAQPCMEPPRSSNRVSAAAPL